MGVRREMWEGRGRHERKEGRRREDEGKMGKRCWYQDVCH